MDVTDEESFAVNTSQGQKRPFSEFETESSKVEAEAQKVKDFTNYPQSFMQSLFHRNLDDKSEFKHVDKINEAFEQLEGRLGNAGRSCIAAYQKWGSGFWDMPEADLSNGLIQSYFNQMLIVVGRRKKVMDKLHRDKRDFIQFPPITPGIEGASNNANSDALDEFFKNTGNPVGGYLANNCVGVNCESVLKYDLGHFKSIKYSIDQTRGRRKSNDDAWMKLVNDTIMEQWSGENKDIIPIPLRSLIVQAIAKPSVGTWSNAITSLVLFKYYLDSRFDKEKKQLYAKYKTAHRALEISMVKFWNSLNDKNSISTIYESNSEYPDSYTKLMSHFTSDKFETILIDIAGPVNSGRKKVQEAVQEASEDSVASQEMRSEASKEPSESVSEEHSKSNIGTKAEKAVQRKSTRSQKAKDKKDTETEGPIQFGQLLIKPSELINSTKALSKTIRDVASRGWIYSSDFDEILKAKKEVMDVLNSNPKLYRLINAVCAIKNFTKDGPINTYYDATAFLGSDSYKKSVKKAPDNNRKPQTSSSRGRQTPPSSDVEEELSNNNNNNVSVSNISSSSSDEDDRSNRSSNVSAYGRPRSEEEEVDTRSQKKAATEGNVSNLSVIGPMEINEEQEDIEKLLMSGKITKDRKENGKTVLTVELPDLNRTTINILQADLMKKQGGRDIVRKYFAEKNRAKFQ